MTDTELRELDVLVSEKVMGECVHEIPDSPDKYECVKCGLHGFKCGVTGPPDRYSTDIAAAMSVVEKFQRDGWMVSVNATSESEGGFWVCMYPKQGDFIESDLYNTASEAICRAALKAVENTQDTATASALSHQG